MTKLRMLEPKNLDMASFNPSTRISSKALAELARDIADVGVLTPISVVPVVDRRRVNGYIIADGHRRVQASLMVGLDKIPAVIIENLSVAEVYKRQFITRRPSGKEVLSVYLIAPDAVPGSSRRRLEQAETIYSREKLEEYCRAGASAYSFQIITRVDNYLAKNLPKKEKYAAGVKANMSKIADWCIYKKEQGSVIKGVTSGMNARIIWKAIQEGEKLIFTLLSS